MPLLFFFIFFRFSPSYFKGMRSFCPINLLLFIEFSSRLFIWSPCENVPTFCQCNNNKYRESPPLLACWRPTLREDLLVCRLNISYYVKIINGKERLVNSSYNTINRRHIQFALLTSTVYCIQLGRLDYISNSNIYFCLIPFITNTRLITITYLLLTEGVL